MKRRYDFINHISFIDFVIAADHLIRLGEELNLVIVIIVSIIIDFIINIIIINIISISIRLLLLLLLS